MAAGVVFPEVAAAVAEASADLAEEASEAVAPAEAGNDNLVLNHF